MRLLAVFALLVPAVALPFAARSAAGAAPVVDVVRVDGIIGPATARYVLRGLAQAGRDDAQALVIELDTPGGLMKSMDDTTRAMLNSPVPTVVYVYPHGARAASAGVFITYAADVAAMAPATHLGAAHPVELGAGGTGGGTDKTMMSKLTNDAAAQIQGMAARRGRNAAWAERAVRQSESITADQAVRLHVVDLVAASPAELLVKIDGRTVRTAAGSRRLATRDARVAEIPMDVTEEFLSLLGDPNVGFILMTIAMYGIIFELSNPGSLLPGVIGGVALVLACASLAVLTDQLPGVGLIGAVGVVRSELGPDGTIFVQGELWQAHNANGVIQAGRAVRVVGVDGLRLTVRAEGDVPGKGGMG